MAVKNRANVGFGRLYLIQSLLTFGFLALLGTLGYTLTMLAER
jgi:hypothetical protein